MSPLNQSRRCCPLSVILLTLIGLASGCGTREYEKRLNQRTSTLGTDSRFAQMGNAVQIPGTSLTLSMPAELASLNESLDPQRVKIPFADLAERKLTLEGSLTDSTQGKQHYYCYIAVTDANAGGGTDLAQTLSNRVRVAVGNAGQPEPVNVDTPSGETVTWQRSQTRCQQPFYYVEQGGAGRFAEMEGIFEVWSRRVDEANAFVVIAWRVPTVQGKDYVQLDQKASLVAGSLAVKK